MGDSAYDFLGMIIDSAEGSASDRMAFKVYVLQRLHAANFRGVAASTEECDCSETRSQCVSAFFL